MSNYERLDNISSLGSQTNNTRHYGAENGDVTARESENAYSSLTSSNDEYQDDSASSYVELMRGSVPCPTCRGEGKVPKEQEGKLVALIPLHDERLKPRRTALYVCLAVFVCLFIAGLLGFFLFPRNVELQSSKPVLYAYNRTIDMQIEEVKFNVSNPINISNNNYFAVSIQKLQVSTLFRGKVLKSVTKSNINDVSLRETLQTSVTIPLLFNKDNELNYMATLCAMSSRYFNEFIMIFQFTLTYSYLGHDEQTSLNTYQTVNCGNNTGPPISTLAPDTTTGAPYITTSTELTTLSDVPVSNVTKS